MHLGYNKLLLLLLLLLEKFGKTVTTMIAKLLNTIIKNERSNKLREQSNNCTEIKA
jgi:hypothetical protein